MLQGLQGVPEDPGAPVDIGASGYPRGGGCRQYRTITSKNYHNISFCLAKMCLNFGGSKIPNKLETQKPGFFGSFDSHFGIFVRILSPVFQGFKIFNSFEANTGNFGFCGEIHT